MSAACAPTTEPGSESTSDIAIRVPGYDALFHAWDAAPEGSRELDAELEAFLRERVACLPTRAPLRLAIHLPSGASDHAREPIIIDAVRRHLRGRLMRERREAKKALWLAILFLIAGAGLLIASAKTLARFDGNPTLISDGLQIGGWVFVWEFVNTACFRLYEHGVAVRRMRRLAHAQIVFANSEA